MNGTVIARVAKVCALLGFFLPWALISCSGQPVASISGLSMAMGDMAIKNPMNGVMQHQHTSPNIFLLLALVAIVGGLGLSFRGKAEETSKETARILCIGAAAAAVLSVIGVMTMFAGRDQAIAKAQAGNQFEGSMAGMVQVSTRYGFWVTLLALGVAAGATGLVITDRQTLLDTLGSEARRVAAAAGAAAGAGKDDDERYWDHLTDKNDPATLEEYLHRFPQGKFASLARARLQRSGAAYAEVPAVAEPAPSTAAPVAATNVCPACHKPSDDGARFCSACGAAMEA